jgi:hypothetical protein
VASVGDTGRAVSPELVLVDPDLAARARASLPDHPWPAPVPIEPRPPAPPPSRAPFGAGFWLTGLALVLAVAGLTLISTNDRPTFAAEVGSDEGRVPASTTPTVQAERSAPTQGQPAPTPSPAQPTPTRTRTNPGPAPSRTKTERSAPPPAPTRPRTSPPATTRTKTRTSTPRRAAPTPRRRQRGFKPARVFSWPPRAGAAFYQVVFLRNSKPFYRAHPTTPRVQIPRGVRFTAGIYRWTVRPAVASDLGVQLGLPIVDSTFKVNGD